MQSDDHGLLVWPDNVRQREGELVTGLRRRTRLEKFGQLIRREDAMVACEVARR